MCAALLRIGHGLSDAPRSRAVDNGKATVWQDLTVDPRLVIQRGVARGLQWDDG